MTKNLPIATEQGAIGSYDLFNAYIRDPNSIGPEPWQGSNPSSGDIDFEWRKKDLKAISRRVAQVLNTYLILSSVNLQGDFETQGQSIRPNATATVTTSNLVQKYRVSKTWSTIGVLSSLVFLLGGIASVAFAHMAKGPEVLGYVSTVMRDSKFLGLGPDTGYMAGMDMSKMCRNMRIRLGSWRGETASIRTREAQEVRSKEGERYRAL